MNSSKISFLAFFLVMCALAFIGGQVLGASLIGFGFIVVIMGIALYGKKVLLG